MFIYKITNKINNKTYIGLTTLKNPHKRINRHFNKFKHRYESVIWNATQKYGRNNFTVEIIEECTSLKELNKKEIYYIKKYNTIRPNGYNIKNGGEGGGSLDDSTKKKISKALKDYYKTNEGSFKGKAFSKEHLANLSKARKGFDSVARKKAREESVKGAYKKVKCIKISTGEIFIFKSISEAAKCLKIQGPNISRVCRSKQGRTQVGGYRCEYLKTLDLTSIT